MEHVREPIMGSLISKPQLCAREGLATRRKFMKIHPSKRASTSKRLLYLCHVFVQVVNEGGDDRGRETVLPTKICS